MCTVIGGINTIWSGSAIVAKCGTSNQITLRHSGFSGITTRSCNSGAVVGQTLPSLSNITENCYISQLSTMITSNQLNGTNIICQYDDTMLESAIVDEYIINLRSGKVSTILY